MRAWIRAVLTCVVGLTAACTGAPAAIDLDGRRVEPLSASPVAVLVFLAHDCPISNRYVPEINRISGELATRHVPLHLVYPDASAAQIRAHRTAYALRAPALRDPLRELVRAARVSIVPSAAVFRDGKLVYHGRIDDRFVRFGHMRPAPTTHELEDAALRALAGKAQVVAEAPAVGCTITLDP